MILLNKVAEPNEVAEPNKVAEPNEEIQTAKTQNAEKNELHLCTIKTLIYRRIMSA
jgi:hypothetical protein